MTRTHPAHELAPVNYAEAEVTSSGCYKVTERLGSVAASIRDFLEDLGIFQDGPYYED